MEVGWMLVSWLEMKSWVDARFEVSYGNWVRFEGALHVPGFQSESNTHFHMVAWWLRLECFSTQILTDFRWLNKGCCSIRPIDIRSGSVCGRMMMA
jgi:hypothetical protein